MASHPPSPPFANMQSPTYAHTSAHSLSLRSALAILAALLILFGWLHLILALQIAATGNQIQIKTEEREKLERDIAAILYRIAEAESPERLQQRASEAGYKYQNPIYLPLPASSDQVGNDRGRDGDSGSATPSETAPTSQHAEGLLKTIVGYLESRLPEKTRR